MLRTDKPSNSNVLAGIGSNWGTANTKVTKDTQEVTKVFWGASLPAIAVYYTPNAILQMFYVEVD